MFLWCRVPCAVRCDVLSKPVCFVAVRSERSGLRVSTGESGRSRHKFDPLDKTTSSLSKMPSPWSQQVAGPQRKLKSGNMEPGASQGTKKNKGISYRNVWLLYIGGRGAEVITAAHPCHKSLTAKSARGKEVMR